MAVKIKFPRHVYKKGGSNIWNERKGITYDAEYVTNKKEYDIALKAGFIDDFHEALFGDPDTLEGDYKEEEKVVEENPKKEPKKTSFFSKKKEVEEDDDF